MSDQVRDMVKSQLIGMWKAIDAVRGKRERQVSVHGRTRPHDDWHADGEIARAAIPYIQSAYMEELGLTAEELLVFWPWPNDPPKLAQPRRELLINAAALLIAEIERLDRIEDPA